MRWSLLLPLAALACTGPAAEVDDTAFPLALAPGAPAPFIPADNALTEARVELGRALFFDPLLSNGAGISCASCHLPDHAFSDTVRLSRGVHGAAGMRNAPSLVDVAYRRALMWDGGVPSLEQQVLAPVADEHEMGTDMSMAAAALSAREPYATLSRRAYGRELDLFCITHGLAAYERTLLGGTSRYDRFVHAHDSTALGPAEQRGMALFDRSGCAGCHNGWDLTDDSFRDIGLARDAALDPGRERITLRPEDRGGFRVPTLRNIALTAPYMHDGSMATLEQVIDHFARGGAGTAGQDTSIRPRPFTARDKADLVAFLHSLTDERTLPSVTRKR